MPSAPNNPQQENSAKQFLAYYSRREIQKRIVESAKDREVGIRYGEQFGKRPDILQYPGDVLDAAKHGASSFHISEERWKNPLDLAGSLSKRQIDELRTGFDIIIDIDTPNWQYAKYTAYLIIEALKFHELKSVCAKFSGGKGFHIAIPFEVLPETVNNIQTRTLFPELSRTVAGYLKEMIKPKLIEKIMDDIKTPEDMISITNKTGKGWDELKKKGKFDPFSLLDIDVILISSRHLFRSPYSLHEKTGLVSLPIQPSHILDFEKEEAHPERISTESKFLDASIAKPDEAKQLIMQALDFASKAGIMPEKTKAMSIERKEFSMPEQALKEDFFPDCIKLISRGLQDGRKRALFILLNFLKCVGWDYTSIERFIEEWNRKNAEPLREQYIRAQIEWHKRQNKSIPPPNCSNEMYYKDLGLCTGLCIKFKNPVNAALAKARKGKK
ncbi:hypothetical protein HZB88_01885 [archaeon]|nr:hypothetical protein [archaeon]